MLHGVDANIATAQSRRHACINHGSRRHWDVHGIGQINAPKDNACIRLRRAQCELYTLAAVQSNADSVGQGLDRALLKHSCAFYPGRCLQGPENINHRHK